jgi:lysophosphatidate acyltransferase
MKKTTVIAKRQLLYVGTFGLAAWLCGLVFINKKSRDESRDVMMDAIEKLKKDQTKLWIFPEGTRRNTGEIHEFKKGAFHVAIESQIPIVPVIFSSYKRFLDDEKKIFNSGEIIIEALPDISTTGLTFDDINKLIQKTRQMMIDKFTENNKEIELKS